MARSFIRKFWHQFDAIVTHECLAELGVLRMSLFKQELKPNDFNLRELYASTMLPSFRISPKVWVTI